MPAPREGWSARPRACYMLRQHHPARVPIAIGRNGSDGAAPTNAFPVPSYLPAPARIMLPFARAYAVSASRRYRLPVTDCWDEAITALVRAAVYFRPGAGRFHAYARAAIIRGLWRYGRRPPRVPTVTLEGVSGVAPDVE